MILEPKKIKSVTVSTASPSICYKVLTPWKESYNQPRQHIGKQRHYFANNLHLVKATVFPVVMYGFESWTINKGEH